MKTQPVPRVNKADNLAALWKVLYEHYPQPVQEHRFDSKRRWRFDLAWPEYRLAVEIDGDVHRFKDKFGRDLEKLNAATALGWRVLRFTTTEVEGNPVACMQKILGVLAP